MDSLVGYGSDDDIDTERNGHKSSVGSGGRRREDDTNYDDVNMDMSEESQGESEPELPPADSRVTSHSSRGDRRSSNDSRDHERSKERDGDRNRQREYERNSDRDHERCRDRDAERNRDRDTERNKDREAERNRDRDTERNKERDRERERDGKRSPEQRERRREHERRSPRRDDRNIRPDRSDRSRSSQERGMKRGLLGDKPEDKATENKVPALMDLKPYGAEPPSWGRSHDARDAVSPRFVDRDRRDRDKDRERERERDRDSRHSRHSEERRARDRRGERRSRSRGAAFPPPHSTNDRERRSSPSGDYRPSSYKVNKKLEVMEKMGLQIKTPDGTMATAQQLRAAAGEPTSGLPSYCNPGAQTRILDQVQKRKLLWSHKTKAEPTEAAKWTGAKFAQDSDGKQVSKFMRLMGIKDSAAVPAEVPDAAVDPNKKQEELFQAMQAQYDVARATTHTMRGVGLGFQRGVQF